MAIKAPHQTVLVVTFEHISNADGGSIQPTPILPSGVFICIKTNMTSIGAITVDGVTGELVCHHHPQLEKHAHPIVFSIQHQRVATSKWMQLTTSSVVAGQKDDKNNLYHYYFNAMLDIDVYCVLPRKGMTGQPAGVTGSYSYGHLAHIRRNHSVVFNASSGV